MIVQLCSLSVSCDFYSFFASHLHTLRLFSSALFQSCLSRISVYPLFLSCLFNLFPTFSSISSARIKSVSSSLPTCHLLLFRLSRLVHSSLPTSRLLLPRLFSSRQFICTTVPAYACWTDISFCPQPTISSSKVMCPRAIGTNL